MPATLADHWQPAPQVIVNHRTGCSYCMVPAREVSPSANQCANLVSICNQPSIYDRLLRLRLGGRDYGLEEAWQFLAWGADGWEKQTHFLFFVLDRSGLIAAALDIKSNTIDGAQIGYWCSEKHRGLMTNALGRLLEMARAAGFRSLSAQVRNDNARSIAVLTRSGFECTGAAFDGSDSGRYMAQLQAAVAEAA